MDLGKAALGRDDPRQVTGGEGTDGVHVARGQSGGPEVGPTVGEVHFEAGVVVGRTLACVDEGRVAPASGEGGRQTQFPRVGLLGSLLLLGQVPPVVLSAGTSVGRREIFVENIDVGGVNVWADSKTGRCVFRADYQDGRRCICSIDNLPLPMIDLGQRFCLYAPREGNDAG